MLSSIRYVLYSASYLRLNPVTLFHCWKATRGLNFPRNLSAPEYDQLHIYSPWSEVKECICCFFLFLFRVWPLCGRKKTPSSWTTQSYSSRGPLSFQLCPIHATPCAPSSSTSRRRSWWTPRPQSALVRSPPPVYLLPPGSRNATLTTMASWESWVVSTWRREKWLKKSGRSWTTFSTKKWRSRTWRRTTGRRWPARELCCSRTWRNLWLVRRGSPSLISIDGQSTGLRLYHRLRTWRQEKKRWRVKRQHWCH